MIREPERVRHDASAPVRVARNSFARLVRMTLTPGVPQRASRTGRLSVGPNVAGPEGDWALDAARHLTAAIS